MTRFDAVFLFAVLGFPNRPVQSQAQDSAAAVGARRLDSLLRAGARRLSFADGRLTGDGGTFLFDEISKAQFVAIGERHDVREIPRLVAAILDEGRRRYGFTHLATENGESITRLVAIPGARCADTVLSVARHYPNAFEFGSDEDLDLVANACGTLGHGPASVWGLDQEFSAGFFFDRLSKTTPSSARSLLDSLKQAAAAAESRRVGSSGGRHWMGLDADAATLERLVALYPAAARSERAILGALDTSARIYTLNRLAGRGQLTAFTANDERETKMKSAFMTHYRRAVEAGEAAPKVVVKMGSAHLGRGQSPFGPFTVGNFLSDLAQSNGRRSFHFLALAQNDKADSTRPALWAWGALRPIADIVPTDETTIIDLRPLRPFLYSRRLGTVQADLSRFIYGYDAIVIIGGANNASETIVRSRQ